MSSEGARAREILWGLKELSQLDIEAARVIRGGLLLKAKVKVKVGKEERK